MAAALPLKTESRLLVDICWLSRDAAAAAGPVCWFTFWKITRYKTLGVTPDHPYIIFYHFFTIMPEQQFSCVAGAGETNFLGFQSIAFNLFVFQQIVWTKTLKKLIVKIDADDFFLSLLAQFGSSTYSIN